MFAPGTPGFRGVILTPGLGFSTSGLRLPSLDQFGACGAAGVINPRNPGYRRSATMESTRVDAAAHQFFQSGRHSEQVCTELSYSYSVGGTGYTGQYSRMFDLEDEALEFVRDKSTTTKVMAAKPAQSLVFDSEIENLINGPPPRSFDLAKFLNVNGLTRYWFTPFLPLFTLLATIGFLFSVWGHVGALLGRIVAPLAFFWDLHVAIFAVFFPAILATKKIAGNSVRISRRWLCASRRPGCIPYLRSFRLYVFQFFPWWLFKNGRVRD